MSEKRMPDGSSRQQASRNGYFFVLDRATGEKTGQIKWKLGYGNATGILTTAGRLLFTSNSGYAVAVDPATGKTLWKSDVGGVITERTHHVRVGRAPVRAHRGAEHADGPRAPEV
jgi:glucose dehydrogenase